MMGQSENDAEILYDSHQAKVMNIFGKRHHDNGLLIIGCINEGL